MAETYAVEDIAVPAENGLLCIDLPEAWLLSAGGGTEKIRLAEAARQFEAAVTGVTEVLRFDLAEALVHQLTLMSDYATAVQQNDPSQAEVCEAILQACTVAARQLVHAADPGDGKVSWVRDEFPAFRHLRLPYLLERADAEAGARRQEAEDLVGLITSYHDQLKRGAATETLVEVLREIAAQTDRLYTVSTAGWRIELPCREWATEIITACGETAFRQNGDAAGPDRPAEFSVSKDPVTELPLLSVEGAVHNAALRNLIADYNRRVRTAGADPDRTPAAFTKLRKELGRHVRAMHEQGLPNEIMKELIVFIGEAGVRAANDAVGAAGAREIAGKVDVRMDKTHDRLHISTTPPEARSRPRGWTTKHVRFEWVSHRKGSWLHKRLGVGGGRETVRVPVVLSFDHSSPDEFDRTHVRNPSLTLRPRAGKPSFMFTITLSEFRAELDKSTWVLRGRYTVDELVAGDSREPAVGAFELRGNGDVHATGKLKDMLSKEK